MQQLLSLYYSLHNREHGVSAIAITLSHGETNLQSQLWSNESLNE